MINTNATTHSNQRLLVLRKNILLVVNEHKRQNIKNIITANIECCIVEVTTNDCKYVIA